MITSNVFSGKVNLTARWDKDGNPLTQESGDITTDPISDLQVGTKNIKIVLNKILE